MYVLLAGYNLLQTLQMGLASRPNIAHRVNENKIKTTTTIGQWICLSGKNNLLCLKFFIFVDTFVKLPSGFVLVDAITKQIFTKKKERKEKKISYFVKLKTMNSLIVFPTLLFAQLLSAMTQ